MKQVTTDAVWQHMWASNKACIHLHAVHWPPGVKPNVLPFRHTYAAVRCPESICSAAKSPYPTCAKGWSGVQGVPVRVEVGPRDVQQGTCVVSRRDQPGKQGKQFGVPLEPQPFVSHVQALLQEIQDCLYADVSGL